MLDRIEALEAKMREVAASLAELRERLGEAGAKLEGQTPGADETPSPPRRK